MLTHGGDHGERRPRPRHPGGDQGRGARLPRRRDRGAPRRSARRGHRRRRPSCSPSSARSTCTCCRRTAAAVCIEAREKAFWVAKQNGAERHHRRRRAARVGSRVHRGPVARIAEQHADVGRRAAATPATATCTCRCSSPTTRSGARSCAAILEAGIELGGAISAEHGIGKEKKQYFLELEDPAKLALMRRIKDAFDPEGILNPGTMLDCRATRRRLRSMELDERRARPDPHARRRRRRRLLREPRHVGDALRRRARRRARDARGARAVRRRRDRRGRRLRPHGRTSPAATLLHLGPGLGNGLREPPQRPPGPDADREHRRRPRDVPPRVRRAAHVRHRRARAQRVGLGPRHDAARNRSHATRPTRLPRHWRRPGGSRRSILPADTTWLEAGEPAAAARRAGPPRRRRRHDRCRRQGVALRRAGRAAARRRGLPRTGLRAASRGRAGNRREAARRGVPARIERGAGLPAVERLGYFAEFAARAARRRAPPRPGRHAAAGLVLRVSGEAEPPRAGRMRGAHARRSAVDDVASALEHLADALGADAGRSSRCSPPTRPDAPTGELTADVVGAGARRSLPEGAIVSDEAQTGGLFVPGATAGCASPRLADAHRRIDRARACRSRPVPPSPAPTDGS